MATNKTAKKAGPSDEWPKIYVGPTNVRLGAINRTIYSDYPPSFVAAAEQKPLLKLLFVPIVQYPAAEKRIEAHTGGIWNAYVTARAFGGDE